MIKDTTKEAAGSAEALLLDDWFDAIEDGVRSRVRGIETMPEAELSEALSRLRYGRRRPEEDEATALVVGVRHGHCERTLGAAYGGEEERCAHCRRISAPVRRSWHDLFPAPTRFGLYGAQTTQPPSNHPNCARKVWASSLRSKTWGAILRCEKASPSLARKNALVA